MSDAVADQPAGPGFGMPIGKVPFPLIVPHLLEAITLVAPDGTVLYTSADSWGLLGHEPNSIAGAVRYDLVHPDDLPGVLEMFVDCQTEPGRVVEGHARLRGADGSWQHIEGQAVNLLDDPDVGAILLVTRNVTDRVRAMEGLQEVEQLLLERLDREKVLTQISTRFVEATVETIDEAVNYALERLGRFALADRAYVFRINADDATMDNTHEWCADGIEPQIDVLKEIPVDAFPWWMGELQAGRNILLETLDDLPAEAVVEREILEPQGVQSLAVVRLTTAGKLVGFVGFDAVAQQRTWDPPTFDLLNGASRLLGTAVLRAWAEAELRTTNSRLAALLKAMQEGILVEDEHRRIALVNDRFCTMFGIDAPPEALLGGDCAAAATASAPLFADPEGFLARTDAVLAAHEPVRAEELLLADGRAFERDYSPVSVAGRHVGNMWVYRDVTDERALRDVLAEARDRAVEANELKTAFVATVSHELRTPLHAVLGLTEILLSRPLPAADREMVTAIRSAGKSLGSLVDDVLDFSRIEAGGLTVAAEPFDLRAVVEEVGSLLRPVASEKGVALGIDWDPTLPPALVGDARCVRQILTNLVGNAVKFTSDGSVRVGVRAEPWGRPPMVRLTVTDTGPGISHADTERLFEPFAQIRSAGGAHPGGTGLGLAITRRLAEALGGELGVVSQPGFGSTFWCTVPLRPATGPVAEPSGPMSSGPALLPTEGLTAVRDPAAERRSSIGTLATSPVFGAPPPDDTGAERSDTERGRVLLVEDNPVNRLLARQQLARLGFAVDEAPDAATGLALAPRGDYRLVLLDLQLDDLDGFAIARRIREMPPPAGTVPIVAVSANVIAGTRQRCLDAGMDDFVSKPVGLQHLSEVMDRWAPGPAPTPQAAAPEPPATSQAAPAPGPAPDASARPDAGSEAPGGGTGEAASAVPDPADLLDEEVLRTTVDDAGGDAELAATLLELYLGQLPDRLAALRSTEGPGRAAHTLGSASLQLGVMALGHACRTLEAAGDEAPEALIAEVETLATHTEPLLRAAMARLAAEAAGA